MGIPEGVPAAGIEATIRSLTHVRSACVVMGKNGDIEEVHILANASAMPKQVVRDVESALMAQFGVELDHKKISVAQTQDGKAFRFSEPRLRFSDVSISLDGARAEATVHLSSDGEKYTGAASGHSSGLNQLRLIATATLRAAENCRESDGSLVLEDLGTTSLSGRNVVVISVNMITLRGEEAFTGSAIVKQDLWKAVVNATLDAVNRRLGLIVEE